METIFTELYCLFESIFGVNVAEHLRGWQDATSDYTGPNLFFTMGLVTLVISLAVALIYYYVINHPNFNRWFHWLIVGIVNSIICFCYGFYILDSELKSGNISDSLLYVRDEEGEIIQSLIDSGDCWLLGLANLIVGFCFFFICSMIVKWWSGNAKTSPF